MWNYQVALIRSIRRVFNIDDLTTQLKVIGTDMTFTYIRHCGRIIKVEEGPIHLGGLGCVFFLILIAGSQSVGQNENHRVLFSALVISGFSKIFD